MDKLTVDGIIKESIALGMKNAAAIVVNALLWAITFWIPYLGLGTTIGMFVGIVAKVSRGEALSFTEVFDPMYRKRMGEFFLGIGLSYIGTLIVSILSFGVGGIVLGLAWSQSGLLIVDKEMNPMEAIDKSNKVTYGQKAGMFLGYFVLMLVIFIAIAIVAALFGLIHPFIGGLFMLAGLIAASVILVGAQAYVYKTLCSSL